MNFDGFLYNNIYMSAALIEADKAANSGEIPVGAVVVYNGKVIAASHNDRERRHCVTGHAELNAINIASEIMGDWRLTDCELYVTMEPCMMCMGAIIQSRIKRLYYGCADPVLGACRSVINIYESHYALNGLEIYDGVMEEACSEKVKRFFINIRRKGETHYGG